MKRIYHLATMTGIFLMLFLQVSCWQEDFELSSSFAAELNEHSATITWRTNTADYTRADISVYAEETGEQYSKTLEVNGGLEQQLKIEGLKGMCDYRYMVELYDGTKSVAKEEGSFCTPSSSIKFQLTTRDSFKLGAELFYLSSWEEKVPCIVMMHELTQNHHPWENSATTKRLIRNGYACMLFYFRGHTHTSPGFDTRLFDSEMVAYYLGCDIEAAIEGLKQFDMIEPEQLGLTGGSLGAAGSVIGNLFPEVKASVPLGAPTRDHIPITEFFPELEPYRYNTISFIAGELDITSNGHNIAQETEQYYYMTDDPKEIWIVEGCAFHGSRLLSHPGVEDRLMNWFTTHLPSPYNL